jgi:hypothetical protein
VSRLRRVRITQPAPARTAAATLGRTTYGTFTDAMRLLVIEDLRPGVVHVGDLPRLTRTLAWLGFILVFTGVGMLFFNEPLREAFPLIPMVGGTTGRGELVPFILIPVTVFILSVAWGFMLAGAVWWLVRRYGGDTVTVETLLDVAKRVALPLIAIYLGFQGIEIVVLLVGGLLGLLFVRAGLGGPGDPGGVLEWVDRLTNQNANWQTLIAAVAMVAALLLARRGRLTLAVYLGIVGANALWISLTNPGRPLSFFAWSGLEPVDFWWVTIFAAVAGYWLVRGRLTEDRARVLLLLVVITLLMRQTGFIEDPFSPVLGFTGVGMIALGLVWDALTIGFWANEDSRGLPRASRIWLYLGYILFSIAVLNWSVASHDILQVDFFTGQAALGGFGIFGKPLIYAIFAVTLARSAMEESEGEPEPLQEQTENLRQTAP